MASVGLGTLELDPLLVIFEYLDATSPQSAKCLRAANRYLHGAGRLVTYRYSTVTYEAKSPGAVDEWLARWLEDDGVLRSVRDLTVKGYAQDGQQHKWATLCRVIRSLSNLRTLVWTYRGPIPIPVLEAVHTQPNAKLKIFGWTRRDPCADHTDPEEIALAQCSALVSIQAVFRRDNDLRHKLDLRQSAFWRVVANAPSLHSASVINFVDRRNDLSLREAEAKFYTHLKPNSPQSLTLDGYPLSANCINEWASFVDMDHLESLKFSRGILHLSYFDRAPRGLKHLSLNFGGAYDGGTRAQVLEAASDYIRACASLQSLSLWAWDEIDLSVILTHGPTLESLHLHQKEDFWARRILTLDELRLIHQQCPRLRELTTDRNRDGESLNVERDREFFSTLSAMKLRKVQLYFNLSAPSSDIEFDSDSDSVSENMPLGDAIMRSYVQEVWRIIFGDELRGERALDVKFGEWESKERLYFDAVSELPRTFWQVRPGDEIGACQVTCFSKHNWELPV